MKTLNQRQSKKRKNKKLFPKFLFKISMTCAPTKKESKKTFKFVFLWLRIGNVLFVSFKSF